MYRQTRTNVKTKMYCSFFFFFCIITLCIFFICQYLPINIDTNGLPSRRITFIACIEITFGFVHVSLSLLATGPTIKLRENILFYPWSISHVFTVLRSKRKQVYSHLHGNIFKYKYIFLILKCTICLVYPAYYFLGTRDILFYHITCTLSLILAGPNSVLFKLGFLRYGYKPGLKFLFCLYSYYCHFHYFQDILFFNSIFSFSFILLSLFLLLLQYYLRILTYVFFHHLFLQLL